MILEIHYSKKKLINLFPINNNLKIISSIHLLSILSRKLLISFVIDSFFLFYSFLSFNVIILLLKFIYLYTNIFIFVQLYNILLLNKIIFK
jgi:hypothetical protein